MARPFHSTQYNPVDPRQAGVEMRGVIIIVLRLPTFQAHAHPRHLHRQVIQVIGAHRIQGSVDPAEFVDEIAAADRLKRLQRMGRINRHEHLRTCQGGFGSWR